MALSILSKSLNPISILSASDVCECCIVLYRNPFCPMAIRCPSDVKYFWCEQCITLLLFFCMQQIPDKQPRQVS